MSAKADLLATSRYVAARTLERLRGVTEEELLWSPVTPVWSLRREADGTWRGEHAVAPVVEPFTTLGWRLWHLTATYGESRNATWLGVDPGGPTGFEHADPIPATAEAMLARLEAAQAWWHGVLEQTTDASLEVALGEIGGQWAEASRAGFVLHQLDEQIHHGAECGVLRDLYRATFAGPYPRSLVRAVRDGLADEVLSCLDDPSVDVDEVDEEYGATALHFAAGAGDVELIRRLLARGADPARHDRQFDADARGWAEFFGRTEALALFDDR